MGKRGLPEGYWRACALAVEGRFDEAREAYRGVMETAEGDGRVASLVANDLAAMDAMEGKYDEALEAWRRVAETDEGCLPARLNRDLVAAEIAMTEAAPMAGSVSLAPGAATRGARPQGPGRVAIVSFLFNWPSTGGGTVHTFELAGFLSRAGYDVPHVYARFDGWGIGQVVGELPYPAEEIAFRDEEWSLAAILDRFRAAVRAFDPDQVIITDSWNIKPLLAEAVRPYPYLLRLQALECLCPLNNVRLLYENGEFRQCTRHQLAAPADCCRCLWERGKMSGALHQAERELCGVGTREYHEALLRAFAEAETVLVVNPLAEAMAGPFARDVRVVTAGIDARRFPAEAKPAPREPWAEGRTVFLFAGLVDEPMKGFRVLHEACAQLWQRRQDFILVATADPPGAVDEFTRFVGWKTQDELPEVFRTSDVLVFPTVAQEALGRTAVEAMAAGLPVVASRIGGLPYTVADGATGLLFEPGDVADLARKLETLLDDKALRSRLGRAGRQRFEEHYDWDVIIDRHYRPLLQPDVADTRNRVNTG